MRDLALIIMVVVSFIFIACSSVESVKNIENLENQTRHLEQNVERLFNGQQATR
jgi:hypothetical protein